MSVEHIKKIVIRFLEEVWGQGDLDVVNEIVAEDHVHHLSRRDCHSPEGVMELV